MLIWHDGQKYSGSFENGFKHGKGYLITANNSSWDGTWNQGAFQHGKATTYDGYQWVGTFKNEKLWEGTYNGFKYKNGKPESQCTML